MMDESVKTKDIDWLKHITRIENYAMNEWLNEVETLRNCVWFEKLEAENV